ncbi:hypothetical protein [Metapseudomonas otitidis]|uniref:hypothetical protein n=1 Tax=Metapseudomonas otitidis TaxID=319939 RepID=UPI002097C307|nr:hypothetical protein [Pseudomonas otitidis]MCO7556202.1 hypothetical protein [Pseudomonas otitidis]
MEKPRADSWAAGANNIAKPERLPEGAVASAVNVDPTAGGKFELRVGFEQVLAGATMRALFEAGDLLVLVDGTQLLAYDPAADIAIQLGTISASGPVAATYLNDALYLNTLNESLRFDGQALTPWALPAPRFEIQLVAGQMPAGLYKVAVTAVDGGVESGVLPLFVRLNGAQDLRVLCNDPRDCRVYCSVADGQTLYLQGMPLAGAMRLTYVADDTQRLETAELERLPFCDRLSTHNSLIIGSRGRYLYHTEPMWPHLHNPVSGFLQFASEVVTHASVGTGLFVATTSKTYFITGIGTDEVQQVEVLNIGAAPGSAVQLPDKRVTWFTQYGQAIGSADGVVSLPNRPNYAPDIGSIGAAGVLEHNGNQMVVTNMRGELQGNRLRARDFASLEVIDPCPNI